MYYNIIISVFILLSVLLFIDLYNKYDRLKLKESYKNSDKNEYSGNPYFSTESQIKGYEDYGPLLSDDNQEVSQCMYNSEGTILCNNDNNSPINISYWEDKNKLRQLNVWGDN